MKAIADNANLEPMPAVSHWLRYSDAAKAVVEKKPGKPIDKVNAMVQENVFAQLSNIKTHPSVAVGLRNNSIRLHGWVYDIESGEIRALDKETKTFVSLSENPEVSSIIRPFRARMPRQFSQKGNCV
jgi:carbonic anhydrase